MIPFMDIFDKSHVFLPPASRILFYIHKAKSTPETMGYWNQIGHQQNFKKHSLQLQGLGELLLSVDTKQLLGKRTQSCNESMCPFGQRLPGNMGPVPRVETQTSNCRQGPMAPEQALGSGFLVFY